MRFESPRDILDDFVFAGLLPEKDHDLTTALAALRGRREHAAFHQLATAAAEEGVLPAELAAPIARLAPLPGLRLREAFDESGVHVAVSTAAAASALAELPAASRAKVTGLSILSGDALELLEPRLFPALTDLQVALDEAFGPDLAAQIGKFALEHLQISHCGIGAKGLAALSHLRLRTLRVFFDQFPDGAAAALAKLASLEELSLGACGVRAKLVKSIAELGKLRSLGLAKNDDLDGRALAPIAGLSELLALDLEESPASDAGVAVIAKLRSLERLSLYRARVTGKGLGQLESLGALRALQLHGNEKLGAVGVRALASLTALSVLDLSSCELGPAALEHLGAMESLRSLELSTNDAKVKTLEVLSRLRLHTLIAENWSLGDKGAAACAELGTLVRLDLSDQSIGPKGAQALTKLRSLRALALLNDEIGISGTTSLGELALLEHLVVSTPIGDKGAEALGKLKKLRRLEALDGEIGPKGATALSALSELRALDLSGSHVGDAGAAALSELRALRSLRLPANDIGPKGVKSIARLSSLRELNLSGNPIGAALGELEKLTSLERLELADVRADKATRARLAKAMPGCVVDFED